MPEESEQFRALYHRIFGIGSMLDNSGLLEGLSAMLTRLQSEILRLVRDALDDGNDAIVEQGLVLNSKVVLIKMAVNRAFVAKIDSATEVEAARKAVVGATEKLDRIAEQSEQQAERLTQTTAVLGTVEKLLKLVR